MCSNYLPTKCRETHKNMIKFGHILIIMTLVISWTQSIQSLYSKFFTYGDLDEDNAIRLSDYLTQNNEAWTKEWDLLIEKMPKMYQDKFYHRDGLGISFREFREMSKPDGMYINRKYGNGGNNE